jgi:hypothetical protein
MRRLPALRTFALLTLFSQGSLLAQSVNVLTWHSNNWRSGANTAETILTTSNVVESKFGKLCSVPTDGNVYAQPLIVINVPFTVNGVTTTHNVGYAVTENDSVYAFDANTCALLKSVSMVPVITGCTAGVSCEQPVDCHYIGGGGCQTIAPTVGVLGTPAIDLISDTLYLVAETQVGSGTNISAWIHRIHALDIRTLAEKTGSPAIISGSAGSNAFISQHQIQRAALLALDGVGPNGDNMVYVSFSLMDGTPEKLGFKPPGWMFGFDGTNLASQPTGLPYVFTTTPTGVAPDGPGGGIWQASAGPSAGFGSASDSTTYIFVGTGDGTWDAGSGGNNYADSFLKLTPSLQVADFFTRYNEPMYDDADEDYGSGGMMLVPDNTIAAHPYISVNIGKDGNVYVVDRGSPGGYNCDSDTNLQTIAGKYPYLSTPAFWDGHLYDANLGNSLKSWHVAASCNPGPVCTTGMAATTQKFIYGATPSISSNGNTTGTGIVWAVNSPNQVSGGTAAVLYAFDALTLKGLYASNQCGGQDRAGPAVKFVVPTVANGKVYIGTQTQVDVYGELATTRTCSK